MAFFSLNLTSSEITRRRSKVVRSKLALIGMQPTEIHVHRDNELGPSSVTAPRGEGEVEANRYGRRVEGQ